MSIKAAVNMTKTDANGRTLPTGVLPVPPMKMDVAPSRRLPSTVWRWICRPLPKRLDLSSFQTSMGFPIVEIYPAKCSEPLMEKWSMEEPWRTVAWGNRMGGKRPSEGGMVGWRGRDRKSRKTQRERRTKKKRWLWCRSIFSPRGFFQLALRMSCWEITTVFYGRTSYSWCV